MSAITQTPAKLGQATAYAAFAAMCLAWGSTFIAIKEGVSSVPPIFYAGLRFTLAGALLLIWVSLTSGRLRIAAVDLRRLALPGLLMITVNYGLLTYGVRPIDSGLAAVVNFSSIALSMLVFSVIYRREKFTWGKLAGIVVGIVGLVLLFAPGAVKNFAEVLGVAAIVIGAPAYAWGTVMGAPVVARYRAIDVSAFQMTLGGVVLVVVGALTEPVNSVTLQSLLEPAIGGSLLYLVIFGSLLGFTLYQSLIKVWPATRVAAYTFICPVIAVALGAIIFGERITAVEAFASVLMLGGAYVVMWARTREDKN